MPEYFDVVDEEDKVVGRETGLECVNRGLLHRAILVFLLSPSDEIYLQKRAENLLLYPGFWSASCTGHVSSGETYLDAARREMKEELGLECNLQTLTKFMSPKWKIGARTEWEFIMVFETIVADRDIKLSNETQEGKFVSLTEFERMLATEPERFTPDTILAAQRYHRIMRSP